MLKVLIFKKTSLQIEDSDNRKTLKEKIQLKKPIPLSHHKILIKKLFFFLIIINLLSSSSQSSIVVDIEKSGNNIQIYYDGSIPDKCNVASPIPSKISINGEEKTTIKNKYDFTGTKSVIQLEFETAVTSVACMFYGCRDLTLVDLTYFESSEVTQMYSMFESCTALRTIYFSNMDTTKVTDMHRMFYGCTALTSLDLSRFKNPNTLEIYSMFE